MEYRIQRRGLGSVMGSQRDPGIDEVITRAVSDLPSPNGLATPERAASDRVVEVTFTALVHGRL